MIVFQADLQLATQVWFSIDAALCVAADCFA